MVLNDVFKHGFTLCHLQRVTDDTGYDSCWLVSTCRSLSATCWKWPRYDAETLQPTEQSSAQEHLLGLPLLADPQFFISKQQNPINSVSGDREKGAFASSEQNSLQSAVTLNQQATPFPTVTDSILRKLLSVLIFISLAPWTFGWCENLLYQVLHKPAVRCKGHKWKKRNRGPGFVEGYWSYRYPAQVLHHAGQLVTCARPSLNPSARL